MKIMTLEELKNVSLTMCYGIELFNNNEMKLIYSVVESVYETYVDVEKGIFKDYVDYAKHFKQMNHISDVYGGHIDIEVYRVIISRLLFNNVRIEWEGVINYGTFWWIF